MIYIDGIKYFIIDLESLWILSHDFEQFISAWLKPQRKDVFIDIGAHIGKYILSMARLVSSEGFVVAIEPNPLSYQTLERKINLNEIKNIRAINMAAWDTECMLKLFTANWAGRNSLKIDRKQGWIDVKARRMDDVLKELGIG